MARKKKEPKYERKRRRMNITLSDQAHDFLKNRVTNASRFIERLIEDAEKGIAGAYVTVSPIGDAANRVRTCDMLVNSPLDQFRDGEKPISGTGPVETPGEIPGELPATIPEKKPARGKEVGYFLTAIKPDTPTLRKMADKHNITYEKMQEPKEYAKYLKDDLSRYLLHGTKADARRTTLRPLSNNVQRLIRFAKDAKTVYGKPRNQITKVSGTVTYATIREFNAHCNTLGSDTPLMDVRRFLTYIGKEKNEPMLITWAETLKYETSAGGTTFATEGEKTDIPKDGPARDIQAYYAYIINPATRPAARKQAFRNLVAILFATTTGIRVIEYSRLTWSDINKHRADEKISLTSKREVTIPAGMIFLSGRKAKTGDARAIPIHPAIIPYLELLEQVYPNTHFHETQFVKTRAKVNDHQAKTPANYTMAQIRNFAAKYWRDYGIRAFYRLSIMGHDTDELKKEIESGLIDAGEVAEVKGISSAYVGYSPPEILAEYSRTIGAKFNPIPRGVDIKKIEAALNL